MCSYCEMQAPRLPLTISSYIGSPQALMLFWSELTEVVIVIKDCFHGLYLMYHPDPDSDSTDTL